MKHYWMIFAPILALTAPTNAQSEQWTEVTRDGKGGIYYMRTRDMVNRTDQTPDVWIKGYHEADKSVLYRSSMTLYEIDCQSYDYAMIEGIYYHADGRVRNRQAGSRYNVRSIVPDSVMDTIALSACP